MLFQISKNRYKKDSLYIYSYLEWIKHQFYTKLNNCLGEIRNITSFIFHFGRGFLIFSSIFCHLLLITTYMTTKSVSRWVFLFHFRYSEVSIINQFLANKTNCQGGNQSYPGSIGNTEGRTNPAFRYSENYSTGILKGFKRSRKEWDFPLYVEDSLLRLQAK